MALRDVNVKYVVDIPSNNIQGNARGSIGVYDGGYVFTHTTWKHFSKIYGNEMDVIKEVCPPQELKSQKISQAKKRKLLELLVLRDGNSCYFCGKELGEDQSIEHLIPASRGGGNSMDNMVLAHDKCNKIVGDMPLSVKIKYKMKRKSLIGRIKYAILGEI